METNNKNVYIIVAVIVLVLLVVGSVYLVSMSKKPVVQKTDTSRTDFTNYPKELPKPSVQVKNYGLGGKVVSIKENVITLSVQRVVTGPNGNFVTNEDKIVTVGSNTKIFLTSFIKGKFNRTPATISNIKVGDSINLTSTEDMAKMDAFTPTEIEVQKIK